MTNDIPHANPPTEPIDWEAIARYLAGESTSSESAEVRRWMEEHADEAQVVADLDRAMASLRFLPPSDVDVEGALRRVTERLDRPAPVPLRPRTARAFA